jgi:hypothetical protein
VTGIDAFRMYLAMRNHFNSKSYNFLRSPYSKAKPETYDKRKDKYFFVKLSRKYDEQQLAQFYLANFVADNCEWIGAMSAHGEKNYISYQKKIQSLSYTFREDASMMRDVCEDFDCLFRGSPHPTLIKLWLGNKISLESVVIMEKLFGFVGNVSSTDPVWETVKKKILKYEPLLHVDTTKQKKILQDLFL